MQPYRQKKRWYLWLSNLFCPEGWLDSDSFRKENYKNFTGGIELSWEPQKGLSFMEKPDITTLTTTTSAIFLLWVRRQ
jgi:hypothetical protein